MKEFDSLKRKPYFKRMEISDNCQYFEFETESETMSIKMYFETGYEIEWMYHIRNEDYKIFSYGNKEEQINKVKEYSKWFYDIILETKKIQEKRERIRKLFI